MPTDVELEREFEWRMCRGTGPDDWEACRYWIENYVFIRHPERGKIHFKLRAAQLETLEVWVTQRYSIVLKARQIGYSTLSAALALWLTFCWSDKAVIMLSKTEREAQKLFAKAMYAFKYLPIWMKNKGPEEKQSTLLRISFHNESSIECLPSTQDPARGESAYLVIVDEWAFLENAEEAWASIEPVADVGGRVIGLSTANGSGNFFHEFWVQAVEGESEFVPLFFPWSANSERDDEWYETKKRNFARRPWVLYQEYPRSAEEAFIRSGRSVFDLDMLAEQETVDPLARGHLWAGSDWSNYAEFRSHEEGELLLYEAPTPGSAYVIGADVAEGLEHGDFSSAHVIDAYSDCVVACWHGHVAPDVFGQILYRLGYWYNAALLGVEYNNHGLTTVVALQKARYPRLYYSTAIGQKGSQKTRRIGWGTDVATKPYVIDGLDTALRGKRLVNANGDIEWDGGMGVRDAGTLRELRTYIREADGRKMHGSPHDDRVMSLAIAQEMVKFAHHPAYKPKQASDYWTMDWWKKKATSARNDGRGTTIGGNSVR